MLTAGLFAYFCQVYRRVTSIYFALLTAGVLAYILQCLQQGYLSLFCYVCGRVISIFCISQQDYQHIMLGYRRIISIFCYVAAGLLAYVWAKPFCHVSAKLLAYFATCSAELLAYFCYVTTGLLAYIWAKHFLICYSRFISIFCHVTTGLLAYSATCSAELLAYFAI